MARRGRNLDEAIERLDRAAASHPRARLASIGCLAEAGHPSDAASRLEQYLVFQATAPIERNLESLPCPYKIAFTNSVAVVGQRLTFRSQVDLLGVSFNVTDAERKYVGHTDFSGCFRCHDGLHAAADKQTIGQDYSSCHDMIAVDEPAPEALQVLGLEAK